MSFELIRMRAGSRESQLPVIQIKNSQFKISVMDIRGLLEEMVQRGASDLHLTVGERPKLRIDGSLADSAVERVLTCEDTLQLASSILGEQQQERFAAEDELDFSFGIEGLSRFRGNAYRQRGGVALAIRQVPFRMAGFEELKLPPVVRKLADRTHGLVLVTGPTGAGKSTTLAAMVDTINRERSGHILTIEDPIEFVHTHRGCLVNQREVGADTRSFAAALKHALRQDPDVLLVGEMRDLETIQAALTIAETGHLCLATLHTSSTAESVNRIIDVFPAHQQAQVRTQLSQVLEGVVTQALLPRLKGGGRVVACEVLICTPAVRACIRDDKVHQIHSLIQAGRKHGMLTLNDALCQLYLQREVALDECLKRSPDPNDLLRMVGGPA
jgi:twitching motility protein PilT